MKKLFSIFLITCITIGCAGKQQYNIPHSKTQSDFLLDREICVNQSGYLGGGFMFGPLIIIFPIFIVMEIIKANNQKDFQKCMIAKGYVCAEGCWNLADSQSSPKTNDVNPTDKALIDRGVSLAYEKQQQLNPSDSSIVTNPSSDEKFIAYENGTVLDKKANLMWASKDNGANINWERAKSYCESYNGGGYTDWRMPTLNELAGLYDKSKEQRYGYHLTDLIQITHALQWSANTNGSDAAAFYFLDGDTIWTIQSNSSYKVIPVRNAK